MSLTRIGSVAFAMLWLCMAMSAVAFEGPVQKKVFTLATYTTGSGKTIKNVRVGYETYGTLNAAGDNAIFIPHFFTGNSHAAGKYTPTDPAAGYWDPIIGAGKPIDTDKFFVISADALANLSTKIRTSRRPALQRSIPTRASRTACRSLSSLIAIR